MSAGYINEDDLQRMLADEPSLIPGVSAQAVAVREFASTVGPSDVVIVDVDGTITIVECKLASNAEIRRKIVGQVLDYAARMWKSDIEDFVATWRRSVGSDRQREPTELEGVGRQGDATT
jgi:hypothetical protein